MTEPRASYGMYSLYRLQVLAMFTVFAAAALGMLVAAAAGAGPPAAFALLWTAALSWNAYWFLWRIAYHLEFDGRVVTWRTPMRTGEVNIADIVELRPSRLGSSMEVVELAGGSRLMVFARKGLAGFAEALRAGRPELPVRFGLGARFAERFPGRSGLGGGRGRF